jgi:hypothetical protein
LEFEWQAASREYVLGPGLLERWVEKRKQVLGDDHLDTLTSMANLVVVYRS